MSSRFDVFQSETHLLTINITHFVQIQVFSAGFFQRLTRFIRPIEAYLLQRALEHLHEAVCICMVMYSGAVALTPTQGHQVVLTVALVHEIPRVPVLGTNIVNTGCYEKKTLLILSYSTTKQI